MPKEIQNLLILVYADQTNRSFVRYGGNYTPTLDDLPDELELVEQTLPDLKDWQEATTRASEILGHGISKLLNASNLATLAAKVKESISEFKAECDSLPDRLQLVLKKLGVPEADAAKADRVRTAKAVKTLLVNCEGKEPTPLVGAIAQAKIETNSTAMGRSLKGAKTILESLRATKWELFSAVAMIAGEKKTEADQLLQDVCTWLKTDEHALAGGLASKLTEAEARAIKLLTPPPPPPLPPPPPPGWKQVSTGTKTRLSHDEALSTTRKLTQQLEENPELRLTVQWTLEEPQ